MAAPPLNPANIATDGLPTRRTLLPGWYKEDQKLWSVTATLDHALTEHLSIKGEVVYQQGSANHREEGPDGNTSNSFFCNKSCEPTHLTRNQVLLGAQMTYEF
jgi:hypothetical protein